MKMIRVLGLVAMLFAAPLVVSIAASPDTPKAADGEVVPLIRVLDHIWLNSARNHDPIPQQWLFADEFVEVHSGGEVVDGPTQAVQIGSANSAITEIHPDEIVAHHVSSDTVITTDTTTIGRNRDGVTNTSKYHVLRVYAKQSGRWRAVAAGLSKIGFEPEHVMTTSEEHAGKDIGGPVADELKELDRKWLHAALTGDTDYMASLFAGDFVEVQAGGEVLNKQQQIQQIKSPGHVRKDLHPDDIHVRCLSSDLAVLTDTTTMSGTNQGRAISGQYRVLRVFVKQGGNWKAAAAALTSVAAQ